MNQNATTVGNQDVSTVFNLNSEERAGFLEHLGVKNATPPLAHSPCLKNKKTGIILPWNPMLAEQRDILECCDKQGNTDPAAWQDKVQEDSSEDERELMAAALNEATSRQSKIAQEGMSSFRSTMKKMDQPAQSDQYGDEAVPYEDIEKLMSKAEF
jgi:hypothetical protein|nr:MAG TPA: hypothetical protein [Caudoviricetes sp.]